jgi:S-formylglutathione hydrolase FrmB
VRRLAVALALLLLLAPAVEAGSRAERALSLESGLLGRALPYSLYLPDGYRDGRRYPTLYLLHGLGGAETDWLGGGDAKATLDRLIAAGAIPPLIVVMPGVGNSWYVDNPDPGGLGAVASAVALELPEHIEATLPALPTREGRAIAGLSMGGFGALRLALLHPDRYVAAAGLSPALFLPEVHDLDRLAPLFHGAFGTPLDPERLAAANPLALVASVEPGAGAPAFFLTTGDDDPFELTLPAAKLHAALRARALEAELRVTDGGHDWAVWAPELETVLRFIGQHLATPETPDGAQGR